VGKTVCAAALMHRYRCQIGVRHLKYWKPIQTGIEQDDDSADVARLGTCEPYEMLAKGVRLEHPVSPHLAARMAGRPIDLDAVADLIRTEPATTRWIVEGAGGALVPINASTLMVDLMKRLGLPVLVVSRSTLGTINHTLMTLEALRSRSLIVAGVVMIGPADKNNREAIETYGGVPVVGEMPRFDSVTPDIVGHWAATALDPAGSLERHFQ
jgi:dethiobiotin synthase